MSEERYRKLGRYHDLDREIKNLRSRAEGLAKNISSAVFAMDGDVLNTDGESVLIYAVEYKKLLEEANALRTQRDKLKDDLGL